MYEKLDYQSGFRPETQLIFTIPCQNQLRYDSSIFQLWNTPLYNLPYSNLSLGMPPGKTNSSVVPTLYPFPDSLFPSPPSPARLELVPNPVREEVIDSRPLGGSYSSDRLLLLSDDFDLTMTAAGEVGLIQGITRLIFRSIFLDLSLYSPYSLYNFPLKRRGESRKSCASLI